MLSATSGCLETFGPDVGPPISITAVDATAAPDADACNADSDPGTAVSYRLDILPQMQAGAPWHCLKCHAPGREGAAESGLVLSDYESLRQGGQRSGAEIVIAGRPCESILFQKLQDPPPFRRRMPRDGPPYLSSEDMQLIHDWIAEGAQDN